MDFKKVLGRCRRCPCSLQDNFKFYAWRDVELAGIPCRALRVSFTGELGWELHPATADVAPLSGQLSGCGGELLNGCEGRRFVEFLWKLKEHAQKKHICNWSLKGEIQIQHDRLIECI